MQIRLVEIFVLTIVTAAFLFGLVFPTVWLTAILYSLSIAILLFAAAAALGIRSVRKYFWRGFSVVALLYLMLVSGSLEVGLPGGYPRTRIVTDLIIEKSFPLFHQETMQEWEQRNGLFAPVVGGVFSIPELPQLNTLKIENGFSQSFYGPSGYVGPAEPLQKDVNVPRRFGTIGHLLFLLWFAWIGGHISLVFAMRTEKANTG